MTFSLDITTRDDLTAAQIATAREAARAQIIAALDNAANEVTGDTPMAERLSWERKAVAADAYLQGAASDAQIAMLRAEAEEMQCSIGDLAKVVVGKATAYAALAARFAGLRQKFTKRIQEAATVHEVKTAYGEFETALTSHKG